ncbi:MAG: hypothetical protein R2838_03345 [Caldilineaceae bacterium]
MRIRDGMLASETPRARAPQRRRRDRGGGGPQSEEAHEEDLRGSLVLDRAGRVHIPQEFPGRGVHPRAPVFEVTEDGILIRRVDEGVCRRWRG